MAGPTPLPNPYKFPFGKAAALTRGYAATNPHYGSSSKSAGPGLVVVSTLVLIGRCPRIVALLTS